MTKEKISSQEIIDQLALQAKISKRAAEDFLKVMISTIEDSLLGGEAVKVKGLGTFRLQWNEPRKSVNVTTGEEIILEGFHKVSFTPEAALKELVNEPFAHLEPVLLDSENNFVVPEEPLNVEGDSLRLFSEQAVEIKDLLSEIQSLSPKAQPQVVPTDEPEEESEDEPDLLAVVEPVERPRLMDEYDFGADFDTDDEDDVNAEYEISQEEELDEPNDECEDAVPDADPVIELPIDEVEFETQHFQPVVSVEQQPFAVEDLPVQEQAVLENSTEAENRAPEEERVSSENDDIREVYIKSEEEYMPEPDLYSYESESVYEAPVYEPEPQEPEVYRRSVEDRTYGQDREEDHSMTVFNEDFDLETTPFMVSAKRKRRRRLVFWILLILLLLIGVGFSISYFYIPAVHQFVNERTGFVSADAQSTASKKNSVAAPAKRLAPVKAAKVPAAPVDSFQLAFDARTDYAEGYIASEQIKKNVKLTNLAEKYYGNKEFWVYIYEANQEKVDNPDKVLDGTLIRIPKLDPRLIDAQNPRCLAKAKELREKYVNGQ